MKQASDFNDFFFFFVNETRRYAKLTLYSLDLP